MPNCLFCRMIAGEIKAKVEFEDQDVYAIHDINPQAPHHLLIIPKKHIEKISDLETADIEISGKLLYAAKKIAASNQWTDYRLVFNNGPESGQSVYHIHLHLISGRRMTWPPG